MSGVHVFARHRPGRLPPALATALVLVPALVLAGCGAGQSVEAEHAAVNAGADDPDDDRGGEHASAGEGLTVAAPVYPLAWAAAQIAPEARIELLADAGADSHDIELTPRARELVETADLVVYMGEIGYQPQIEAAVHDRSGDVVSFADAVGTDSLLRWDDHDHAGDDAYDPHAWFDAELMAEVSEEIGSALASMDPGEGDAYETAAADLAAGFRNAGAQIAALFEAGCAHDRAIVSHEAYAYLLRPFGLRQEGVSGVGGHGPASPQRIGELVRTMRDESIAHVLAEPTEGRDDALAVAAEAQAEVLDIHSLETIDAEQFDDRGFLELLIDQAETTARAMQCD